MGCAFGRSALGIRYKLAREAGDLKIAAEGFAGRGSQGALDMDRLILGRSNLAEETTLATARAKVELFSGRVAMETQLAWNREWDAEQDPNNFLSSRFDDRTGSASTYKFKVVPIAAQGVRWSVSLEQSRASKEFQPQHVRDTRFFGGIAGSNRLLSTRIDVGRNRLKASVSERSFLFGESDTAKIGISRIGIGLTYDARSTLVAPTEDFPELPLHISERERITVDLNLYEFKPLTAVSDNFLATLLPKVAALSIERGRSETAGIAETISTKNRRSLDFFGMWETALGDTMINYRRDRERRPGSPSQQERDSMIMLTHSVGNGRLRVSGDAMILSTRSESGAGSFNRTVFFGGSLKYNLPEKVDFEMRIGRDETAFDLGQGLVTSRDSSTRIEAKLDLTQAIRSVLGPSSHLSVEYRQRASASRFELEILEGVFDTDFASRKRKALLVNFGMTF